MKTDNFIDMLWTGAVPLQRHADTRRLGVALLLTVASAGLLMEALFGVRPDLAFAARTSLFLGKIALALFIALGALVAVSRLARPGARIGASWLLLALPVALVWIGGGAVITLSAPAERMTLLLGHTWRICPYNILLLSAPGFFAVFRAVRGLAPTQLRAAGAASGLLAGVIATLAYSFHCPEMSPAL